MSLLVQVKANHFVDFLEIMPAHSCLSASFEYDSVSGCPVIWLVSPQWGGRWMTLKSNWFKVARSAVAWNSGRKAGLSRSARVRGGIVAEAFPAAANSRSDPHTAETTIL